MAREPRRKPLIQSDTGRVLAGTKRRAITAVPEAIDPEETPLPTEPPAFVEGLDDLPPPAQAAIQAINTRQREQDVTIARMHHVRHLDQDIADLREAVGSLTAQTKMLRGVPELLRVQATQFAELRGELKAQSEQRVRSDSVLDDCTKMLREMQRENDTTKRDVEGLTERVDDLEANDEKQDAKLGAIEQVERDKAAASKERQRWFSWARGGWKAAATVWSVLLAIGGYIVARLH